MNVELEVLKTDLPGGVDTLACKMEALGNGEIVSDSSRLSQGGFPTLPTLKFRFRKTSTHVGLLFRVLSGDKEQGSCMYPLTFNSRLIHQAEQLVPSARAKDPHLAYLSSKVPNLDLEKVVGRIWFKIKDLKVSTKQKQGEGSKKDGDWRKLDGVKEQLSCPSLPTPNVAKLISREAELTSACPVPSQTAMVSIIYHSVTTKLSLISGNISAIACIGSTLNTKEDALFHEGEGKVRTLPTLRTATLKCTGTVLELYVIDSNNSTLLFSSSFPLANMLPFKHYNWEFNWRWLPGISGFCAKSSQGNLEPNVTVSVVCWPSVHDYSDFEGLEVYVDKVEFDSKYEKADLVLCCHLLGHEEAKEPSKPIVRFQPEGKREESSNFNMTVIQTTRSNGSQMIRSSAYYFFPSQPHFTAEPSADQVVFILYAAPHDTDLWWHTDATATSSISLTKFLMQSMLQPENQNGVYWTLEPRDIANASVDSLTVRGMSGVFRWKRTKNRFLSHSTVSGMQMLPRLSDLQKPPSEALLHAAAHDERTDMWKEAVTKIGEDIIKLREENKVLKKHNQELEKYILEMEGSIIVTASDQKVLQQLSKNELIYKILEHSERLNTESRARKSLQSKVHKLQNSLIQLNDTESRYVELQGAHTAQQKLVREMQEKVAKYKKCLDTCKQQEAVIGKLEALLARDAGDQKTKELLDTLSKENLRLRTQLSKSRAIENAGGISAEKDKTIEALREELFSVRRKCEDLEQEVAELSKQTGPHSPTYLSERDKVAELERKLEVATIREKAVMEELKQNANKWAKEKAKQEFEIAQLQRSGNHQLQISLTTTKNETEEVSASRHQTSQSVQEHSRNPSMIASPGSRELPAPSPLLKGQSATVRGDVPTPLPTPITPHHSHSYATPGKHGHMTSGTSRHVTSNRSGHVTSGHQASSNRPIPNRSGHGRSSTRSRTTKLL